MKLAPALPHVSGSVVKVVAFLLLVSQLVVSAPSSPQRSNTVTASSGAQSFSDAEMECFAQEKVLYKKDGKCHKLLHQGPCAANQWLVLGEPVGKDATPTPTCRVMPCNNTLKPVFWPEDGQCHKRSDKNTLCQAAGNELRSDSYGNGECACEKTYARFEQEVLDEKQKTGEWQFEGVCYPLFHRGPCPVGKITYPRVLEGFGLVSICVYDFCSSLNNASAPGTSYVMRKEDGKCHKLGTTGPPCARDEIFAVHPVSNLPACYSPVHSLWGDGGVRCGGAANIDKLTGECREVVILKAQSFGFETTRRKRNRRRTTQKPSRNPNAVTFARS